MVISAAALRVVSRADRFVRASACRVLRFAEWDESQHPRNEDGRWVETSGAAAEKLDRLYRSFDAAPRTEGIEAAEDNWRGGVADFGDRDAKLSRSTFAAATVDVSPRRPWHAHMNFAALKRRTEYVERRVARRLATLMARAVWRILGDRAGLGALLDTDMADIGRLKLQARDVASLRAACAEALKDSWAVGRRQARAEVKRARREEFEWDESQHPRDERGRFDDGARLSFSRLTFVDLRDSAADYFEANGFRMAQNLSDGARALIQSELTRAVRVGERPEVVSSEILRRLVERGFSDYEGIDTEVEDESILADLLDLDDPERLPHYVNTLVRTNTFEAMNEARFAEFTDPALKGYVQAFEYSAILDENTTEFCRYMDGRVYAADSEVWTTHRPPNHYNCRSLLIPVTTLSGWDGVESEPPEVEPATGFARRGVNEIDLLEG